MAAVLGGVGNFLHGMVSYPEPQLHPEELEELRKTQDLAINAMVDTILTLRELGVHFLIENPFGTKFWEHRAIRRLRDLPEVELRLGHMCAFNLRDPYDQLLKKPTGWLGDIPEVLDTLAVQCSGGHERGQCMGGRTTKLAQVYTVELAQAFVSGLLKALRRCGDERLCVYAENSDERPPTHTGSPPIYFVDVNRHEDSWRPLLVEAESQLRSMVSTTITLKPSPFMEQVKVLVPWEIARVQLSRTPKQRRLPTEVIQEGAKHRGAALLYNDSKSISSHSGPFGLHLGPGVWVISRSQV